MPNNQQGFTLLEWLISLSIGVFLLIFISKLYISLYKTNYQIERASELHENAQIALHWLAYDIRMSGFIGCPNLSDISLPSSPYALKYSILGSHQDNHRDEMLSLTQRSLQASDILYLQYAGPNRQAISCAKNSTIQFPNLPHFSDKTVLLLSDCRHAEILQLKNVRLKYTYQEDARISRFYRIVYYIALTKRKNQSKQPIYALYRKDLNTPDQPTELVENVKKLELLYGIPDQQEVLEYIPADQVRNWKDIRSIRVILHFTNTDSTPQPPANFQPQQFNHMIQQTIMIRSQRASYRT